MAVAMTMTMNADHVDVDSLPLQFRGWSKIGAPTNNGPSFSISNLDERVREYCSRCDAGT